MIIWLLIAVALGVAPVRTEVSQRRAEIMREVNDDVAAADRYVNLSVLVRVVARPDTSNANLPDITLPNGAPAKLVREQKLGGWHDNKTTPPRSLQRWDADEHRVWFATVEQAEALFHNDPKKLAQLIHGSEGAGKTRLMAMWQYRMWLKHFGEHREGGQTAPTLKRLGAIAKEMRSLFASDWFRYVSRDDFEGFIYCDGTRCRFVSTHRQSASQGSPLQSFNFAWLGRDELQDQIEAHEDCESRGRAARRMVVDGRAIVAYWQLATATAKDSSDWRELRDRLTAQGAWSRRELSIFRTPFIESSFLDEKKKTLSTREFLRRYGDPKTGKVVDLPPEFAVYYAWLRDRNLVDFAQPRNSIDVTAAILRDYRSYVRPGSSFSLLCMHDPGAIYNTTEIARLIALPLDKIENGRRLYWPTWTVVGELQTEQTTAREHALALREKLQKEFQVEYMPSPQDPRPTKACIFVDPHGKGEADTDYQTVYMAFQGVGLDVFNPAPMTGRINRGPRVEMTNRLLGGGMESERPRLVVAKDHEGRVCAPKLVEAFESLKKNPGDKNPEGAQKKDEHDKTHAPAALAYGLWPFEQEAFTLETIKRAIAAARGVA